MVSRPILSITEGRGRLMISGGSEKIGTSFDGVTWDVQQLDHSAASVNDIDRVRFFAGIFVAIMHPDASVIYRSTDGHRWRPVRTGWPPREESCLVWHCEQGPGGWVSIAHDGGRRLLASGVNGKLMLSPDLGATWMRIAAPVTTHLNGVYSDGNRFAVVGNFGTMLVVDGGT
jgi:hypothetical protein